MRLTLLLLLLPCVPAVAQTTDPSAPVEMAPRETAPRETVPLETPVETAAPELVETAETSASEADPAARPLDAPARWLVRPGSALGEPVPEAPEPPPEATAPDPTTGRLFELYWAASGLISTGFSPAINTRVDLALMIDEQWAFGVKVALSYVESRFEFGPGVESTTLSTTLSPGLFVQHYTSPVRTGEALATIRVGLAMSYVESSTSSPGTPRTASVQLGSTLDVSGGVTWLPEPWLAVRILGGLVGTALFQIEGMPEQLTLNFGAFAEAGIVVRI